ncbi:MAG: hypothetical protein JWQ40_2737, partial [Segetibacter sp.]|nr:hypothetical protein [Segetibacter sp.]
MCLQTQNEIEMFNHFNVTQEHQLKPLTFDSLPHAVSQLLEKLNNVERLLEQKESKPKRE